MKSPQRIWKLLTYKIIYRSTTLSHTHIRRRTTTHHQKLIKKYALTSNFSQSMQTNNAWIRNLHEEGTEPHPGPSVICTNEDGLNNRKKRKILLRAINKNRNRYQRSVYSLSTGSQSQKTSCYAIPKSQRYRPRPTNISRTSSTTTRGGTAIIIPTKTITPTAGLNKKETLQQMKGNT